MKKNFIHSILLLYSDSERFFFLVGWVYDVISKNAFLLKPSALNSKLSNKYKFRLGVGFCLIKFYNMNRTVFRPDDFAICSFAMTFLISDNIKMKSNLDEIDFFSFYFCTRRDTPFAFHYFISPSNLSGSFFINYLFP